MPAPAVGAAQVIDRFGDNVLPAVAARVDGRFAVIYLDVLDQRYTVNVLEGRGTVVATASPIDAGLSSRDLDSRPEMVGTPTNGLAIAHQEIFDDTRDVGLTIFNSLHDVVAQHHLSALSTNPLSTELDPYVALGPQGEIHAGFVSRSGGEDTLIDLAFDPYQRDVQDTRIRFREQITDMHAVPHGQDQGMLQAYVRGGELHLRRSDMPLVALPSLGAAADPHMAVMADGAVALVYAVRAGIRLHITERDSLATRVTNIAVGNLDHSLQVALEPRVAALHDGRILVVWTESRTVSVDGNLERTRVVMGRMMNGDGSPDSDEFTIDSFTGGTENDTGGVDAVQVADGRIIVTYQRGNEGSVDVLYRVLDPRTGPIDLTGTIYGDSHVGTEFADTFNELGGDDTVLAGGGNDRLVGGFGRDTLSGEAGNDTISPGADDDIVDGGADTDLLDYSSTTQVVTVDLPGRVAIGAQVGRDTLSNIENVTTGSGNDNIAGNAAVNVLNGGAGIDMISYYQVSGNVIIDLAAQVGVDGTSTDILLNFENANGGHGNDQLSGRQGIANVLNGLDSGAAGDTISYYLDSVAVTINLGTGTGVQAGVTDTLLNFENANGSRAGDTIIGSGGNNVLNGLGGADSLVGAGGNDTFIFARGQAGGDSIADFVGNGAGVGDTIRFTGYGTAAQGSTFTFVSGNTWQVHSGLHGTNELITINGGSGAVHVTDFVFA